VALITNRRERGSIRLVAILAVLATLALCLAVVVVAVRSGRLRWLLEAPAERARVLAKLRRYDEALEFYERARQERPNDPAILRGIAACYKGKGKLAEAYVWAERAAQFDQTPRAHLLAAEVALLAAGTWDPISPQEAASEKQSEVWLAKAEDHARGGLSVDPRSGPCFRVLAEAEARRGHLDKAVAHIQEAIGVDPDSRATRLLAATLFVMKGDYASALSHTTHLLATLGKSPSLPPSDRAAYLRALATAATANAQLGRLDEALASWKQFIEKGGDKALGHLGMAGCLLERGELGAVLEEVEEAQKHIPQDRPVWLAYYLRGRAFYQMKRYEEAVKQFRRASTLIEENAEPEYFLALALLKTGQADEARQHLLAALEKEPRLTAARVRLAELFEADGNLDEALDCLHKGLEETPDDGALLRATADMALRHNLETDAEAALERLSRLRPNDPEPVVRLADLYIERGEPERALALARRALSGTPRAATLQALAARAEILLGRLDAAERRLLRAVAAQPEAAAIYEQLAEVRLRRGDRQGAKEVFLVAMKRLPDPRALKRAYARFLATAGENQSARQLLLSILRDNPKDLATYRALIELLTRVGEIDQALQLAERAAAAMPRSVEAHLLLGHTRRRCGLWGLFIAALDYVAEQLDPENFATYQRLAAHLHEGHYEAAAKVGRKALEAHPLRRRQIALDLGIADFFAGRSEPAIEAVRALVTADHTDCEAGFALSLMELAAGAQSPTTPAYREFTLPSVALDAWTDLLDLNRRVPEKARLVAKALLKAKVYQSAGWPDVAADELDQTLKVARECLMPAYLVALLRERAGQQEKAIAAARRAVAARPACRQLHLMLADLLAGAGRLGEAAAEYQASLKRAASGQEEALTKLALIESARGDLAAAAVSWRRLFRGDPRLMPACNNLAWLLADSPAADLKEALDPATNALAAERDNPAVLDTVGWLHYLRVREGLPHDRRSELRKALDLLAEAVEKAPHRALYHYHLGMALALAGQGRRAEKELREALALDPDGPFADHAAIAIESLRWTEE